MYENFISSNRKKPKEQPSKNQTTVVQQMEVDEPTETIVIESEQEQQMDFENQVTKEVTTHEHFVEKSKQVINTSYFKHITFTCWRL